MPSKRAWFVGKRPVLVCLASPYLTGGLVDRLDGESLQDWHDRVQEVPDGDKPAWWRHARRRLLAAIGGMRIAEEMAKRQRP
jgi:hypothetical protein